MATKDDELMVVLRRPKKALRTLRDKHSVNGEITFRMQHDATGAVTNVTIDKGPDGMTADFMTEACAIVKSSIVLPNVSAAGAQLFRESGIPAPPHVVDADARHAAAAPAATTRGGKAGSVLGTILAVVLALGVVGFILNHRKESSITTKVPLGSTSKMSYNDYFVMLKATLNGDGTRVVRITDEPSTIMILTTTAACMSFRRVLGPGGGKAELPDGVRLICNEDDDDQWILDRRY